MKHRSIAGTFACLVIVLSLSVVPIFAQTQTHDHDHDHGEEGGIVAFLGKFHPAIVHFPIGLILMAGLAELLFAKTGSNGYAFAARFMLFTGAATAVMAMLLGLAAARGASYEGDTASYFAIHRVLGLVIPVMGVLTAVLSSRAHRAHDRRPTVLYRSLLVITILVVGFSGFLGGLLVFGPDHYDF